MKKYTVKELIKYLADFNPNAEIMNPISPSWYDGLGESQGERDIENEKAQAIRVRLWDDMGETY